MLLFLAAGSLVCTARGTFAQSHPEVRVVANVELVQIPVIVFDDKGGVATNLKKDDFRVLEDGVEQRLVYCERERESVSFVILADQSASMTKKIPFVQEAALSLVDPDLPKDPYRDEYSVFGIESRAKRLVPFTRDQHDLERRLPLLLTPTKGKTALFDGIYWGVTTAQREAENKRRAVVITVMVPPMPAFYNHPAGLSDIVDHIVARVLDQFGLETNLTKRWEGPATARATEKERIL